MMRGMKRTGLIAALLICGVLLWAQADWAVPWGEKADVSKATASGAADAAPDAATPRTAATGGTPLQARELKVLTSFYPMHIMALNVFAGVPGVTIEMLAPAMTGCLHDYSLTTEAMRRLEKADLLIANGLGMESYIPMITKKFPRLEIVQLSRRITPIRDKHGPNPHVWVSIDKAGLQVINLTQFLVKFDPARHAAYKENGRAYGQQLEALGQEMHQRLDRFKGAPIVTFHEAFPYFAEEFGLKIAAVIEREPGTAPTPRDLADTIAAIRKQKVSALFSEPQYPSTAAAIIARETGLTVHPLDPAVTGPLNADAYLAIMRKNMDVLEEALK